MKILYCIPTLEHGGTERQLSYLAPELSDMGHEVHIASSAGGPNFDRMMQAGVTWHALPVADRRAKFVGVRKLVTAIKTIYRLVAVIRSVKPDLVQTMLAQMDILGGTAALITRTPWVLREGSSSLIYRTYRKYWLRFAFGRLSDLIIANSIHGYDYWRSVRNSDDLKMIRNGLPLGEIENAVAESTNGFEFRPDEKIVLCAGRIDLRKNVEAFVGALARLRDRLPFTAVVCGDGPSRPAVERLVNELGIADRVIFTGYVDRLWGLMKRADAFVSLSRCEGCPNVVLEAMACGCPVVLSDIPGHRELLDDDTAWFVDPENPEQASLAIAEILLGDTSSRARAGQAKASEWTVETTARQYHEVYLGLLSKASQSQSSSPHTTEYAQTNESRN